MVLSVIIVNYRVKYFLELSLRSVEKALQGLDAEVWVVDNDSRDGSLEYLRPLFPRVQFIANKENTGFGRANNLALEKARGKYVLFLNPDTVLPEDFFAVCLDFLEKGEKTHESAADLGSGSLCVGSVGVREDGEGFGEGRETEERREARRGVGAVGVRMVDGSGRFLKESRRGFPSPWVAFCKLTGLTALFPHSRLLATYYLGHLSPAVTQRAPVLSGACMMVSRAILEEVGGFDEQFFMYAEDIDLSYRIEEAGYHNYYLADTTIVHFKGESTQKDTRYVKLFYKAMSQFRRKHFQGGFSFLFNVLVEAAIWLRAGVTAMGNLFSGKAGSGATKSHKAKEGKGVGTGSGDGGSDEGGSGGLEVRAWLTGDPVGVERLTALLSSSRKRLLVADSRTADEIIFCEGESFSFKEAIAALQSAALHPDGGQGKFYAAGSGSVTGSASKEGRGETIVLK